MRYFPIFFDLDGRDVLIVGGGEKALQKLRLLAKTTARLKIVAADVSEDITAAGVTTLTVERHAFTEADLDGAALVFAASDDPELDARVAAAARARGLPVNVVDGPSQSNFIMPAIVDRDPVVVAIGTEGAAPILAREIKAKIESGCRFISDASRSVPRSCAVAFTTPSPIRSCAAALGRRCCRASGAPPSWRVTARQPAANSTASLPPAVRKSTRWGAWR